MMRTAVILFNLGGPDRAESIRPFLYNFFTDKNIIAAPFPIRQLIAGLIARKRSVREAGISYGFMGGASPLLANTLAQADALETRLNAENGGEQFKCFTCMRYWHPLADAVAVDVKAYAPDRIVLLPLYPQYSTATTRSSFQSWDKAARAIGLKAPTSAICCYPFDSGFVTQSAQNIGAALQRAEAATGRSPRLLFSAHGLPEKTVKGGDPYQWQCERSAEAIVEKIGVAGLDWQICYQSRVGLLKWIGPSTVEALEKAAADKMPVVIYPHAFVNEHVETLVEIEIEYRHLAETLGVPYFDRVETVSIGDAFIDGLADMVWAHRDRYGIASDRVERICPKQFGKCCMADPGVRLPA